ncbi:MAG: CapA family protein [Treponema sp.]|jgi:poly-gamma-glutamate synthesis protein (capsule biosynthesis protein)|nr:CapA family protein [Treponema sp.]
MIKKLSLVFFAACFIVSCTLNQLTRQEGGPAPGEEPAPRPDYLTLVAAGDNLFHAPMIRPDPKTGLYDFTASYAEIKALVEPADIAFINQETVFGGAASGFSGYPRFNTPAEVGAALAGAGFDVINHATNHIMDKGEGAVFATMNYWDTVPGVQYLGIYRSPEERETKKVIIEKNNISAGFLAYTYGTNGLPVPRDKPYLVSLINETMMEKEIAALRPLCDFLVVSMHWGEEYRHTATGEQKRLARFLANQGVDLILGHHPHVIEPYEYLDRPDGGKTLCFYSLGNFLSAQQSGATQLGVLAYIRIKKLHQELNIDAAGVIPVVNHYEPGFTVFRVYPLYNYHETLAEKHLLRLRGQQITVPFFTNLAADIFTGGNILSANPFEKGEENP